MYFSPTTECEGFDTIQHLNPSKSSEFDRISPKFIRVAAVILAPVLERLFNAGFECGFFPNTLKIAEVILVFKTGDETKLTNYRPMSLLSCFSKILEKIVYHREIKFLDKNSVFSPYQFGFRQGCSTVHAIIDIIANCNDNINQQLFSGIIFLDLSKAFDTVDHEILAYFRNLNTMA